MTDVGLCMGRRVAAFLRDLGPNSVHALLGLALVLRHCVVRIAARPILWVVGIDFAYDPVLALEVAVLRPRERPGIGYLVVSWIG